MRTSAAVLMLLLAACTEPALARGVHNHGVTDMPHGGADMAGGSEAGGKLTATATTPTGKPGSKRRTV